MKFLVINGPNLNLLGLREPAIYGSRSFAALQDFIRASAADAGVEVDLFQSNHEGAIVDRIQEAYGTVDGIVINPAAYTHTSIAILDALNAFDGTVIECHISNVHKRESFRHHSFVSGRADGVMTGFGVVALGTPAGVLEAGGIVLTQGCEAVSKRTMPLKISLVSCTTLPLFRLTTVALM